MKTNVNEEKVSKNGSNIDSQENSKIDVIKNLLFGENITSFEQEFDAIKEDILSKKKELNDLIDSTRAELDTAIDSLSTDLNIRITELEDRFNDKSDDLNAKKIDKKLLGDLFIKLGNKLTD